MSNAKKKLKYVEISSLGLAWAVRTHYYITYHSQGHLIIYFITSIVTQHYNLFTQQNSAYSFIHTYYRFFTYSIWILLDTTAPSARSNTVQQPPSASYGHRNYFSFQSSYIAIKMFPLNSSIAVLTTAAIAPVVVWFELALFLRAISFHSNVL